MLGCHSTVNHPNPCPPPSTPMWVIHCDGSFVNDSQEAAFGVVLSNNQGQVRDGVKGTFFLFISDCCRGEGYS
ncbi:hypothetical protein LINPERHAP1_LOCUS23009 [Linum perenne]